MSLRHIRKLYGNNSLAQTEGLSDEEYEPLYAKASPSKFKYQGLILTSHSESEHESTDLVATETALTEANSKKKKNKKKKQRKIKQLTKSGSKENVGQLDEIDKSVMEVNAMLGSPLAPPAPPMDMPPDPKVEILGVQAKHLNPNYELKRLFGDDEPGTRRRGRQQNLNRLLRKAYIVPGTDTLVVQKSGLSMTILRRENGCTYFAFEHSKEYQKIHRAFLQLQNYRAGGTLAMSIEDAQRNMHVEGMLESADSMFRLESYSAANTLIEQTISYMQHVSHPSFNLTDNRVRLEYSIAENRPFHVAILKYLYLLSNRACHRTALELAKLLLNLEPSDPLAVLLIIDTLALRAREHQWLIDAVKHWSTHKEGGLLFNIQYSYALAHFHVLSKKKDDVTAADQLLQRAMLWFPAVVVYLLRNANVTPSARFAACAHFSDTHDDSSKNLKELMLLYAKLTWEKWREPRVLEWLLRNADQFADKYNNDDKLQAEHSEGLVSYKLKFSQGCPQEVVRHLTVIKPMANLIVDGVVGRVPVCRSADPVPPAAGTSRHGYERERAAAPASRPLYDLLASVLPQYGVPPMGQAFQQQLMEGVGYDELDFVNELVEAAGRAEPESERGVAAGGGEARSPGVVMYAGAVSQAFRQFMDEFEQIYHPSRRPDDDHADNDHTDTE